LTLNITEDDNSLDLELVMKVAQYFRISKQEAGSEIAKLKNVIARWPEIAAKYRLSGKEKDYMSAAFDLTD